MFKKNSKKKFMIEVLAICLAGGIGFASGTAIRMAMQPKPEPVKELTFWEKVEEQAIETKAGVVGWVSCVYVDAENKVEDAGEAIGNLFVRK